MTANAWLDDILYEFRRTKRLADRAMAQVTDADFFTALDEGTNSIALIVKHMAGNMRSRWTDFLTADGEKPDRDRDSDAIADASAVPLSRIDPMIVGPMAASAAPA